MIKCEYCGNLFKEGKGFSNAARKEFVYCSDDCALLAYWSKDLRKSLDDLELMEKFEKNRK